MLAILDYKAGNQTSVRRALDHLGIPCRITADPAVIADASGIIFPGVGAAGQAMRELTTTAFSAEPSAEMLVKPKYSPSGENDWKLPATVKGSGDSTAVLAVPPLTSTSSNCPWPVNPPLAISASCPFELRYVWPARIE